MAQRRWIRIDTTTFASDWLAELSPGARLAWVELLIHIKTHGIGGCAKALSCTAAGRQWGIDRRDVSAMLDAATADDAVQVESGDWVVKNWSKYQESDYTNAERQRRFRQKRNAVIPVTDRDCCRVTETETETETEQKTDNDSSLRSESAQAPQKFSTIVEPNGPQPSKPPTLYQQAMPVLRELGYEAKKHDGSILKAIAKKGLGWEAVEPAVRGLALLRDAGGLRDGLRIAPGEQLSMRILYARDGPKDGAQPIWRVAENRWYQQLAAENRKERGKMPRLRV